MLPMDNVFQHRWRMTLIQMCFILICSFYFFKCDISPRPVHGKKFDHTTDIDGSRPGHAIAIGLVRLARHAYVNV